MYISKKSKNTKKPCLELSSLQKKMDMKIGVTFLQSRLNRYKEKYSFFWKVAIHLAWASILSIKTKFSSSKKKKSDPLEIAFLFDGGMGDLLFSLNLITAFYEKFCKDSACNISICFHNEKLLKSFAPSFVKKFISEKEYARKYFDLKIWCNRTPIVQYANFFSLPSDILIYVEKLLDLEEKNKFILTIPIRDLITWNILSPCANKRWSHVDLIDEFSLKEDWILKINLQQEIETLNKFGLMSKKYITINREVGDSETLESNKLWPVKHYQTLVEKLKKKYPLYQTLEVGTGKGDRIGNTHQNLVGKTTLEEIKVIIKHAALHIDGEGGLVHLRHALKAGPSCVVFGPTSPDVLGYSENINLCSEGCPIYCEFYSENWQKQCIKNNHVCMKTISPEFVLEEIEKSGILG